MKTILDPPPVAVYQINPPQTVDLRPADTYIYYRKLICGYCYQSLQVTTAWDEREDDQLALFLQYNDCGHVFEIPNIVMIDDYCDLPIPSPARRDQMLSLRFSYIMERQIINEAWRRAKLTKEYEQRTERLR